MGRIGVGHTHTDSVDTQILMGFDIADEDALRLLCMFVSANVVSESDICLPFHEEVQRPGGYASKAMTWWRLIVSELRG